jgi:Arc/MetJ-type ribon-helix-helix transcriptional regulator
MNDRLAPLDAAAGMTYRNTRRRVMPKAKIAISMDEKVLARVDGLVRRRIHGNRSQAIEAAVIAKLDRLDKARLAVECAKLDPVREKRLAEEGLAGEVSGWPEY